MMGSYGEMVDKHSMRGDQTNWILARTKDDHHKVLLEVAILFLYQQD